MHLYWHITVCINHELCTFVCINRELWSGPRSRPTTFFLVVPGIEPGPPDL
jgi:hypothetical protein